MGVKITELGVVVPGHVVRKRDGENTTLTLTEEQARDIYASLGTALAFFDAQEAKA